MQKKKRLSKEQIYENEATQKRVILYAQTFPALQCIRGQGSGVSGFRQNPLTSA